MYPIIDIIKAFEKISTNFHTSLVEDPTVEFVKQTNVKFILLFALKMAILSVF